MFKNNNHVILKTLLISILMICLSSFFFAIHDTLLKYISSGKLGNIKWYHHVTIGGPFGITMILFFSFFYGGIKKNIILDSYKIPVLRGILSIANFLMAFIALKYISLSIFTTLILTLPFFLVIFSYLILKETISRTIIFSLFVGFFGVVIILRPGFNIFTPYILFPIVMSAISGFNMILVNKYKEVASPYGFAFYSIIFPFFIGLVFFINDPFFPGLKNSFLIIVTWLNGVSGMFFITYAYHRSQSYSNKIAPYIYTQLIWAVIFGYFVYDELFDIYTFIGSFLIVICGIIVLKVSKNKL